MRSNQAVLDVKGALFGVLLTAGPVCLSIKGSLQSASLFVREHLASPLFLFLLPPRTRLPARCELLQGRPLLPLGVSLLPLRWRVSHLERDRGLQEEKSPPVRLELLKDGNF